ncbi:MACPF domain-containing protein NSL1 [Tanacetum coccineum]|uniref:MACPF domain-containing protein NSL1 n=1 Tax=Tanacetum coccineum TaxID=301880 RepID=A0ABQ5DZZ9_9ASTR
MDAGASSFNLRIMNQEFVKLDKSDGCNYTRWADKMKFLLIVLKIFYVILDQFVGSNSANHGCTEGNNKLIPIEVLELRRSQKDHSKLWSASEFMYKQLEEVGAIVSKLPPSWNDISKKLINKKYDYSLDDLLKHLRIERARIRITDVNKGPMFIPLQSGTLSKRRTRKCHVCGDTGHYARECKLRKSGNDDVNVVNGEIADRIVGALSSLCRVYDGNDERKWAIAWLGYLYRMFTVGALPRNRLEFTVALENATLNSFILPSQFCGGEGRVKPKILRILAGQVTTLAAMADFPISDNDRKDAYIRLYEVVMICGGGVRVKPKIPPQSWQGRSKRKSWLSTVSRAPNVISMSFIPIVALLSGARGSGFLSHAINLYLRFTAKVAPAYGDLPLAPRRKKNPTPSLQFTFLAPRLYVNIVKEIFEGELVVMDDGKRVEGPMMRDLIRLRSPFKILKILRAPKQ